MMKTGFVRIAVAMLAFFLVTHASVRAETFTWEGDDTAEWTSSSFDSAGAVDDPTAAGDTAEFGEGATTATVTVDSSGGPVTVGALSFSGTDAYTLQKKGAGDSLTMSGAGIEHTDEQNHLIGADVLLDSDLTATMNTEGYGIEISGDVSGTGQRVTKAGTGMLTLSGVNTYDGGTWIERGVLRVPDAADLAPGVLQFNSSVNNQTTVLETSGSFARDIGTGVGQVRLNNHGGFAAYGGPLSVTLDGGRALAMHSTDFNWSKYIHLGSASATHPVTIVNDIDHNGNNSYFQVFYNPDTDQDVGILAGVMSGNARVRVYGGGTLVVTNSANTWAGGVNELQLYGSVVRFGEAGAGLGDKWVNFQLGVGESVIESYGTWALDLGNSAGKVAFEQLGGFAAHGGPLTLTLNEGAQIDWQTRYTDFYNRDVVLGSRTANNVVTLTNPIDFNPFADKAVIVPDNPHSDDDYAVISGAITASVTRNLIKKENGLLVLSNADNALHGLVVDAGTLRISAALSCNSLTVNGGALQGSGPVTAALDVDVKTGGTAAPGNGAAGTLTVSCNNFHMRNGSTYAFEFGAGEDNRDLIDLTGGNLRLENGWTLRVVDLGTTDRIDTTDEIDLFTYAGTLYDGGSQIDSGSGPLTSVSTDFSTLADSPGEWDYSAAEVRYDADNGRIYLTGLKGGDALPKGTVIRFR